MFREWKTWEQTQGYKEIGTIFLVYWCSSTFTDPHRPASETWFSGTELICYLRNVAEYFFFKAKYKITTGRQSDGSVLSPLINTTVLRIDKPLCCEQREGWLGNFNFFFICILSGKRSLWGWRKVSWTVLGSGMCCVQLFEIYNAQQLLKSPRSPAVMAVGFLFIVS